jgi:hypothetical protein
MFGGGGSEAKMMDQIFNLKFTSKQLVRTSRKCEKEEKEEKNKARAARTGRSGRAGARSCCALHAWAPSARQTSGA